MVGAGYFRWLSRVALVCGLLGSAELSAQATQPEIPVSSDGNGIATLHVYANLIQMPVLVLNPDRRTVPTIKPERFSLSIDDGPAYQPTHVRPEGVDPISLTLVLDFVGTASDLIPKINQAVERVTAKELTPRDHLSLIVMQCTVSELLHDAPAEPGTLQPKITQAITGWTTRDRAKPCEEKVHLWDTLKVAMLRLSDLPGRRVIIVVTDGVDRGSKLLPDDLAVAMQTFAVTTFGLRPEAAEFNFGRARVQALMPQITNNNPLDRVCEMSGGIAFTTAKSDAGDLFTQIPLLVRKRYILEFPRPNAKAGAHHFEVKIAKTNAFIRSSGTSVPLPDPKIAADPTTMPNDPTLAPEVGNPKTTPHLLR